MLLPDFTHVACRLCPWRLTTDGSDAYVRTIDHLTTAHGWTRSSGTPAPIETELTDDERSTLRGCDRLL